MRQIKYTQTMDSIIPAVHTNDTKSARTKSQCNVQTNDKVANASGLKHLREIREPKIVSENTKCLSG